MKSVKGIVFAIIMLFLSVSALSASEIVTNDTIATMVKAGLGEELIISKIKTSLIQFDISIDGIMKLKKEGVSVNIIKEMMDAAKKTEMLKQKTLVIEESEELYKKALALHEDGNYEAADEIFKKLINADPGNNKYQTGHIDTLLEQILILKEAKNPEWETKAKDAGSKIKFLHRANVSNADYYLVYAKYSWIIETKKESNISKALEKAFYFKPNYCNAHITKGDIYLGLAKVSSTTVQTADSTSLTGGGSVYPKYSLGMIAKSAYESALSCPDLSNKKKAHIYYQLGELEIFALGDKEKAKASWEKAVSFSPDSRAGKSAKERLK